MDISGGTLHNPLLLRFVRMCNWFADLEELNIYQVWNIVTSILILFLQLWRRTAQRWSSLSWWAVAPKSQRSPSSVWLPSRDLCPMKWCLRWVSWLVCTEDGIRLLMCTKNSDVIKLSKGQQWLFFSKVITTSSRWSTTPLRCWLSPPDFHCPFGTQLLSEINERPLLSSWSLLSDWKWLLCARVPSCSFVENFFLSCHD